MMAVIHLSPSLSTMLFYYNTAILPHVTSYSMCTRTVNTPAHQQQAATSPSYGNTYNLEFYVNFTFGGWVCNETRYCPEESISFPLKATVVNKPSGFM